MIKLVDSIYEFGNKRLNYSVKIALNNSLKYIDLRKN